MPLIRRDRPLKPGHGNVSPGNGADPGGKFASANDALPPGRTGVAAERDDSTALGKRRLNPRHWGIWARPKRVICYLLIMEALAVCVFVIALANSRLPGAADWLRLVILAAGATVHIQLTQRQEERRRNRTRTVLIDLTAVWVFPAAIILPVPLTLLLVGLIRAQHWFVARRPAHNFVFSSLTHGLASTVAHLAFLAIGTQAWGQLSALGTLREFGAVVVAGLVYEAVQIIYVSGVLMLGVSTNPTVRGVLGSKGDNLLEAITIGLGAVTAVLLLIMPPAVAIMAVVTVVFNRLAELDQLQDDVRTDPKTGVLNMRGWTESAERAFNRASRAGENIALLMIDLDHFKWINDTFGHPAGDDVLCSIAAALQEATRPSDLIGRFGGEEFLVLLPDADQASGELAAERIRGSIAALRIGTTDKRGEQTTIAGRTTSVGVAVFPEHAGNLDDLVQAADAAVYEAKESGRNRTMVARP